MSGIYIASKTKYAAHWRLWRDQRKEPIISTWIDEAGIGETKSFSDLWSRCIKEASVCDVLIVYFDPGDTLKGAWVEVGAALAAGKPVIAVGMTLQMFSVCNHPNVKLVDTIDEAFALASHYTDLLRLVK